ncbi:MAG: hypothetical protein D6762_01780 [Candidatus Neomarinimicrobiota bacterium]|nr:MAG: hypothetical protein D6762_01780 [Candidatus Neomarinimicrobiota bacterium]
MRIRSFWWPVLILVLSGCAYFNTFYNAEQYFEQGEALRLEKAGEEVPSGAREAYKKVITKTDLVLTKYPDSKYVYPALLLQGKARFYRGEYIQAEGVFHQLEASGIPRFQQEARYWLGLIKWKTGQPNPALGDLNEILQDRNTAIDPGRVYLAMAEIHLEIGRRREAVQDLEKAAKLARKSEEREQIYYRLAELSLQDERYDEAIRFYKNVIRNSLSKRRIMEANLQIVKMYRLKGDLKTASNKIKSMLADERFKDIFPDLELELAKLYLTRKEVDQALTRLETITNDYPKTPASAEAYYLLAEDALKKWDLETALDYFGQVGKEDRKSPYLDRTRARIKEISRYQKLAEDLKALQEKITAARVSVTDSTAADTTAQPVSTPSLADLTAQVPALMSEMAELEAFHFDQADSARRKLWTIYQQYPDYDQWAKAAYTLAHLTFQTGDSLTAESIRTHLLEVRPHTEFAAAVMKERGGNTLEEELIRELATAESLFREDTLQALALYRSLVTRDTTSEAARRSTYFLAWFYDQIIVPDSAAHYYFLLETRYPDSEQTKAAAERIRFYHDWFQPRETETEPPDSTVAPEPTVTESPGSPPAEPNPAADNRVPDHP